ncbi:hypothetical protein MMC08_005051 [Hypocenomyce scalaris]|nr:hypothetical protein [Hypocenomyce scalaris]
MSDIRIVKRISDSAKKTKKLLTDSKKKGYKNASTTDEETVELTDISPEVTPTILSTYIPPFLRGAPSYWSYSDTKDVYTGNRVCHGKRETPPGYTLIFVPRNAKVVSLAGAETEAEALDSPVISSIYGVAKIGISLFQSLYATHTVYQARGDQITRYGYAAFALTVAPYAFMSILNLIGNMLTPDYPTLFLVRSEIMAEAEKRKGSRFEGVVGRLLEIPTNSSPELLDGSAFDDVENRVSGTFEARKDDNGDTKSVWHKREGQAIAESNANEANVTSAAVERRKPIELRTKVADEDLPPEYFGFLVPACPRFERFDDIQIAEYFEQAESPVGSSYILFFATITINAVIIGIVGGLSHFPMAKVQPLNASGQ